MSVIPPDLDQKLSFFLTGPLPCPYLPTKVERKLFTQLGDDQTENSNLNSILTRAGFRRSHDIVYRPACDRCQACMPVRVPVASFIPTRSLWRVAAHNIDLTLTIVAAARLDHLNELYRLFYRYQRARHADSDMAEMTKDDLAHMLSAGRVDTRLYVLRDASGKLLAAMIVDHVSDGASAVYSFFEPDEPRRSLGLELILRLIKAMQESRLPYLYLGYLIAASRKMAYKSRFQPLQTLGPQGWHWLTPDDIRPETI